MPQHLQGYDQFSILYWPRGYKNTFVLNSAEHEIRPANKSQITNNCGGGGGGG